MAACGAPNIGPPPGISGPAEQSFTIKMTVTPDLLVADGFSTAVVQAQVFGPNGHPAAGADVFFTITDDNGRTAAIGSLSDTRAATTGQGIAQVIYTAPARTDLTANAHVLIAARLVDANANNQPYHTTRLELRSAEPKLFPPNPDNKPPNCSYAVQAPFGFLVGHDVLFQDASNDPDGTIVRYEWDFGDGVKDDKPDVNHAWGVAGSYTVSHIVTDNNGAQSLCSGSVVIK
jgi:hypothetical protein